MTLSLSPHQLKLYEKVNTAGVDVDVTIDDLWFEMYGHSDHGLSKREQQQYIGSCISRVNVKLKKLRIVPGQLKRTYRLTRTR